MERSMAVWMNLTSRSPESLILGLMLITEPQMAVRRRTLTLMGQVDSALIPIQTYSSQIYSTTEFEGSSREWMARSMEEPTKLFRQLLETVMRHQPVMADQPYRHPS